MSENEGDSNLAEVKPVLADLADIVESTNTNEKIKSRKSKDRKKSVDGSSLRRRNSRLSSSKEQSSVQNTDSNSMNEGQENANRSCSENQSVSSGGQDACSEEARSPVSDTNVPVLRTRTKTNLPRYRESGSSRSSSFESDHRKTRSEPVIITLDSDSEDDLSVSSRRPNRTARIKGELIRKLSRGPVKPKAYKMCDSSSSSDYEAKKPKKKSKARSVKSSSSHLVRRKKYLINHLASKSRLSLKRHRKHLTRVYKPVQKRRPTRSVPKSLHGRKEENDRLWTIHKTKTPRKKTGRFMAKRSVKSRGTDRAVKVKNESESLNEESEQKESEKEQLKADCTENTADPSQTSSKKMRNSIEADLQLIKEKNVQNVIEAEDTAQHKSNDDGTDTKAEENVSLRNENSCGDSNDRLNGGGKPVKKKMKQKDTTIRKRGRPRLTDPKYTREVPCLNSEAQIPFLQSSYCFNVAPKLPKCRECLLALKRTTRSMLNSYCRFMEYRKLCYSKSGSILNAGFSEPSEATLEHLNQWLPQVDDPPKDLNCSTSKSLLEHIGDQFCDLVEQEKEALSLHIGKDKVITWKRIVQGVREMCDVCYTTLFNFHWVCPVCGLAVCIDCYKGRKQGIIVEYDEDHPKNRDQFNWLWCTQRQPHDPERLVLAQIIPGNTLWNMRDLLHEARKKFNIPSYCKCVPEEVASSDRHASTGICKQLMSCVTKSFSVDRSNSFFNGDSHQHSSDNTYDDLDIEVTGAALKWLESTMNSGNLEQLKLANDYFNSYEDFASLSGNLISGISDKDLNLGAEREFSSFSLDDIIDCMVKPVNSENKENSGRMAAKHFSKRYPQPHSGRDPLPIRIYTKLESSLAFSDIPHSWFCNGRLLFLHKADHQDNLALFQEQWKRGQPILVKGVDEQLNMDLWHPDAFCRDFGEEKNDLIDCKTGALLKNLQMKKFWEGFECFDKRMTDDNGDYLLLKLKDWPPGEDFSEMLPERFEDLMAGLPLPEYTRRDGILNLAGRLPTWFVRPDLGPKMYNAYGSALFPTKGTTNLHLDISDAVNVMVYVGIPSDGNAQLHIEEALKAIDEGGCDSLMRARVRARGAKPGALWHIYNARDADKIRDLLTKVAIERGEKLEAHHDPIHDQSWYLDEELRKRLYRDYGVEGYAIAQCLGDAVFIPAGAPHQVRNLHSCVKVAEDFVSPENIAHCFKLTQEFRNLSDTHTNHEDKLQIKNIIYHVVRDALSHLLPESACLEN